MTHPTLSEVARRDLHHVEPWRLSQGRGSPLLPILSDSHAGVDCQGPIGCWGVSWRDHLHLHPLSSLQEYGTVAVTHPAWKKMRHGRLTHPTSTSVGVEMNKSLDQKTP
ncbi:hypothetical protein FH972_026684 [Carpinus fangiana]|uniref:Uncharacterized protein n=1 Tax=Carpinus fangiana TaxID=176857 RepID=A0A5N6L4Q3_9ROSI|nr:hypothetical protein FH972_026684 [Carpinus fangiana]